MIEQQNLGKIVHSGHDQSLNGEEQKQQIYQSDGHLEWLRFWQLPWERAHSSWLASNTSLGLTATEVGGFADQSPHLLRHKLPWGNMPPPEPELSLIKLINADFSMRMQTALLAAEVVSPGFTLAQQCLDREAQQWCRRLAKALLPETWNLPKKYTEQLKFLSGGLLILWVGETIWPRLRLLFKRQWIEGVEKLHTDADRSKLRTDKLSYLWKAVIWRAGLTDREAREHVC